MNDVELRMALAEYFGEVINFLAQAQTESSHAYAVTLMDTIAEDVSIFARLPEDKRGDAIEQMRKASLYANLAALRMASMQGRSHYGVLGLANRGVKLVLMLR